MANALYTLDAFSKHRMVTVVLNKLQQLAENVTVPLSPRRKRVNKRGGAGGGLGEKTTVTSFKFQSPKTSPECWDSFMGALCLSPKQGKGI